MVALFISGLIFCNLRRINECNMAMMACKIGANFDDVLEKVKDTIFGESFTLKPEQKLCIKAICYHNIDVFAQLPTGFGKGIIYQTALLGELCQGEMQQVITISPRVQIMQEQVKDLASHGVKAARIGELLDVDCEIREKERHYEVLFGNAEEWQLPEWKTYLKNAQNIAALVVDEVHTVVT